jgi:hypothetical protein
LEVLDARLVNITAEGDASIGVGYIELSELADGFINQGTNLARLSDIHVQEGAVMSGLGDSFCYDLTPTHVAIGEDDTRTFRRKQAGRRTTDSGSRPRDNGDAILKSSELHRPLPLPVVPRHALNVTFCKRWVNAQDERSSSHF